MQNESLARCLKANNGMDRLTVPSSETPAEWAIGRRRHPTHSPRIKDEALGPNLMIWNGSRHMLALTLKNDRD